MKMKRRKCFYPGASLAHKIVPEGKIIFTWKHDEPGLLFVRLHDRDGFYVSCSEKRFRNNADMFEHIENTGAMFV